MGQTAVLLFAALFRVVWLHDVPPGLAQDEVLNADIVTFIRGGEHALFFRHGFGHEPLYHYFAVPFQILLGDNVLSIRLPAVTLGMLLVAATMRWVRRDFGVLTAVLTGAGLAASWWPIIFSRIGLRPIMEPLLLVGMAYFWKRPLLAGFFLGLSYYTYTGARIAPLIPVLFYLCWWLIKKFPAIVPNSQNLNHKYFITFLLTTVAIAAPMQITLWRNPQLQQRVDQLSEPLDALRSGNVGPIWETTAATLGVFSVTGDPRWTYMVAGRPLFDPFGALFFYAGLFLALSRIRRPHYLLIICWFAVALLPSALTPQAPSTIRLIGALPLVYLLPALALNWVTGGELRVASGKWPLRQRMAFFQTPLLFLLIPAYILLLALRTVNSGFVEWPRHPETRDKYQTVLLDMSRYWHGKLVEQPPVIADAFYEPIDADSFRRNLGYDPDARWVQFGENAGALVWPSGRGTEMLVPKAASLPEALRRQSGIAREPLYRSNGVPSFAVYHIPSVDPAVFTTDVVFEDAIRLIGVAVGSVEPERPFELFTYWEVLAELPWDLTAFVHLLGDGPAPLRQHDGFDVAAERLQPGDIVMQRHLFLLPNDLQRPYTLAVGLYMGQSGVRWLPNASEADIWIVEQNFHFDGNEHDE